MIVPVRQPMIWVVLAMASGIYLRLGVSFEICLFCFAFLIFAFLYLIIYKYYKISISVVIFAFIGFINAGNSYYVEKLFFDQLTNIEWSGVVYESQLSSNNNQKLYISIDSNDSNFNIFIWNTESHLFNIGDKVEFTGFLQELDLNKHKNGFNEKMYYHSLNVDYKCYPDEIRFIENTKTFNSIRYSLKDSLFKNIDELFSIEDGGVLKAILTGIDDYILNDLNDLYSLAGISHILCISGLHLSILIFMLNYLLEKVLFLSPVISVSISCVFSILFLIFIGFTPSLCRATIIALSTLIGKLIFRRISSFNSLAIAGGIILIFNPLSLWNVGFQLSFACISGIYVYNMIFPKSFDLKLSPLQKFLKRTLQAFGVSLYTSLFSFPILAYYFNNISIIGIILNIFIVPLCSLLLISSIFSCAFAYMFMPFAELISLLPKYILLYINTLTTFGIELSFSNLLIASPNFLTVLFYYLLILCVSYYGFKFCNKYSLSILIFMLFLSIYSNELIFKKNTIAFLNVGQGDSTVITTYDNKAIVIDGGGIFGLDIGQNTGYSVVKPYLNTLGINEIEAVFITHFDRDHVLGIIELCDLMKVNGVYISSYPFDNLTYWEELKKIINLKDIPLYTVTAEDTFSWDNYGEFTCFAPQDDIYFIDGDDNHGSLVLKYSYGGVNTILTGDATSEDEYIILEKGYDISSNILKLGHHGSKYSSSSEFLEAVNADIAIVSCGYNNLYNHPHPDTLSRALNMDIYRTDTMGDILLEISPSGNYNIIGVKEVKPIYERIKK